MALTIYGNSQKYGAAAGNKYGRIDPAIALAQTASIRQTALKVTVTDSFPNQWEAVAGSGIPIPTSWYADKIPSTAQAHAGYRLQMGMCVLTNGTIVRVRVGDGTVSDRNIYKQEITDPTVASQWTTWTLAYSGTHYAVGVAPATSSTYHIYAAKSDGLYKNNTLKQARTNIVEITTVQGYADAMYVLVVGTHSRDKRRTLDVYYSENVETTSFAYNDNYDWYRTELSAYWDGTTLWRAQVAAFHSDPRSTQLAESLQIGRCATQYSGYYANPPITLRGFASQAGNNAIVQPFLTKLSDGFYYIFYSESRYDASGDRAISANTIFWQRSKDLKFWTEPIAIGFNDMPNTGFAVVERSGYIYLANNGTVWRRPLTTTQAYDISNYVPSIELSVPRNNGEGSGNFQIANPDGVNDAIVGFTDKEVKVEVGIKVADGSYKYGECNRWWIDTATRQQEQKSNRINVTLYDLWRRLNVPLRDTYNFIGQVNWYDFVAGGRNKVFNYYPRSCTATVRYSTSTSYYCEVTKNVATSFLLYTGWKGHNAQASARWRSGSIPTDDRFGIVMRYQDPKNYIWAYLRNNNVYLCRVVNGVSTRTSTAFNYGKNPTLAIKLNWSYYTVTVNGTDKLSGQLTSIDYTKPGYAGVRVEGRTSYKFDRFKLISWEVPYTTSDLIKTALAMGDFHDVVVAGGEDKQLAVVWGPQTDLKTPAAALKNLLDQNKLDLAWHNGIIHIGRFRSTGAVKTLENEVISTTDEERAGRRINLAVVDGQEDTFIEIDGADTRLRGRQIPAYFDLPELTNYDSVKARAKEEVSKGVIGVSTRGEIPYLWDLWRMDEVIWKDAQGVATNQRIEGIDVKINQSTAPSQHMVLDMSPTND